MTTRLAAALLAAACAAPAAAAPAPLALLPATGSNVPAAQLEAAGDVLRAHLESTGRFAVVRVPGPTRGGEASPEEAADAARDTGADLAVVLRVARLADTGQAYLAAYAPDGALIHSDQLSVLGADDLDPALQRLAEGLARGRRASRLATIDTVTAKEEAPYRKMKATGAVGITFAALMPMNRAEAGRPQGGAGGLGLTWLYDAREFLADVTVTGLTSSLGLSDTPGEWRDPEDAAFLVGMGVYYPFSRGNTSPFLGVGAAYGWTRFGGEGASGLQARAATGLLLGRLSDVQVKVELGWFWNTFAEREAPGAPLVRVHGATASIALLTSP